MLPTNITVSKWQNSGDGEQINVGGGKYKEDSMWKFICDNGTVLCLNCGNFF